MTGGKRGGKMGVEVEENEGKHKTIEGKDVGGCRGYGMGAEVDEWMKGYWSGVEERRGRDGKLRE